MKVNLSYMKNKEVLIFYPYPHAFGGIEELFCILSASIKVKVVCFEDKLGLAKYSKNIEVIDLKPRSYFEKIFLVKKFFSNSENLTTPIMWGYKSAFFAYLACIKKYNVHLDDPPSLILGFFKKKSFFVSLRHAIAEIINKKALQKANVRMTTCKRNAIELNKHYGCNFKYCHPGTINKGHILKKSNKKIFILSISRLQHNKNLDWIINAISLLKVINLKLFKKIEVNIIGKGEEKTFLENLVFEKKVHEAIKFRGFVSNKAKDKFLKKSHIFVIPAVQGYGIPALEALSYKNKLVMNKETRISEIFKNNSVISINQNNFKSFNKNFLKTLDETSNNKKANFNLILPDHKKWSKFIYTNSI